MLNAKIISVGQNFEPKTASTADSKGDVEVIDSTGKMGYHNGTTVSPVVTEAHTATLTNKTFDANGTGNVLSNIETADLASGVLITSTTLVGASNTNFPSTTAIKTYADAISTAASSALATEITNRQNADTTLQTNINTEASTRSGADTTLQSNIDIETAARIAADSVLQGSITTLQSTRVTGPASATDEALVRYDGITGKLVQNSVVTATDAGIVSGITQLNVDNFRLDGNDLTSTDTNGNVNIIPNGTGIVDVQKDTRFRQDVRYDITADTATGANATLTSPVSKNVRLTNASLTSIDMIPAGTQGQEINLINATTVIIALNNATGGTAANQILTGTGSALALPVDSTVSLTYDSTSARWKVIGLTSSGSTATQSYNIENLGIAAAVAASALTIAIKTAAGNTPSALDKVSVAFRNSTSATGQYSVVDITGALSTVISSGSTAGQVSALSSYIYVYLINNAGTAEVAWSRSIYDEGSVVTTTAEGGAGAADSASTIYSTTARTGVALRLVGRLLNTQATAGTWATAPSEVSLVPFINQPVAATYTSAVAQAVTSGNAILFSSLESDTHNAYNTSTGVYTIPVSGYYRLEAAIRTATVIAVAGNVLAIQADVYVGMYDTCENVASRPYNATVSKTGFYAKGATVSFLFSETLPAVNLNANQSNNWMSITKVG